MKRLNQNVCLTSTRSIKVILIISCFILLAFSVWPNTPKEEVFIKTEDKPWVPTQEDSDYQDSMYVIIEQTQLDIDEIKLDIDGILYKLDKLYYKDGSWDSIRYVEGGKIDKALNTKEL